MQIFDRSLSLFLSKYCCFWWCILTDAVSLSHSLSLTLTLSLSLVCLFLLSFGEITKELSASWKALSSEEMAPYNQMAEEDKVRAAGELEAFTSSAPATPRKRASSSAKSPAKKSAAAGPKRPMSSYMHYSKVSRMVWKSSSSSSSSSSS